MKSKPCLTLDDCRKMTAACEAEAKKNNWIVTIAILDDGGHPLLRTRMDGASPVPAEIAAQKGRMPTLPARSAEVGQNMEKFGMEPSSSPPAAFAATVKSDIERWAPIVKASGFTAEH